MNRNSLLDYVEQKEIQYPQRAAIGRNALQAAFAAIDELAKIGLVFDLVDVSSPPEPVHAAEPEAEHDPIAEMHGENQPGEPDESHAE